MTKAFSGESTVVLELAVFPQAAGERVTVSSSMERQRTASSLVKLLCVGHPVAAGCSVFIVPQHGQGFSQRFALWFTKLSKIAGLKDGWDSYSAQKPTPNAIAAARLYLTTLDMLSWEPARVEPSAMGGVGITHKQGSRKVYVEFYNNGTVHALFSDRSAHGAKMETRPVVADIPSYYRFIRKAREYLNG